MNKATRGDEIPTELFKILKDDAVKVLNSTCQQIWNFSSGHRTGKGQFSFNLKEGQCQRMFKPQYNGTYLAC